MLFTKVLLACASVVATTLAQVNNPRIAFTILPQTMTAGKDLTLHWAGGDGSPVTITLQQGSSDNLQTVELVTGSATGTSYTWSVPTNLPNAENYAFRIQQGDSEPNYTGMITLTGGTTGSVTNAVSATAAAATASSSGSASKSSSGSASKSSSGSASSSNSSSTATGVAVGGSSANSTAAVTSSASSNATVTSAGTAPASAGTGASISRNTTLSHATLSSSGTATTGTAASGTGATTTTGGSTGTRAGSAPASSSSSSSAGSLASNFALLVCAFAGVAYFG